VVIALSAANGEGSLTVTDDGEGISAIPANNAGMGLNIMRYRANMIGGSLNLGRSAAGGTTLVCVFPLDARS
jgi:signal transduction histidine kinase